jgi:hypothetical protein
MQIGAGSRIIGNPAAVQAAGWQRYNWQPRSRIITPPTPALPVLTLVVALEGTVETEPVADVVHALHDLEHPIADVAIGAIVVVVILATWKLIVRFVELRRDDALDVGPVPNGD